MAVDLTGLTPIREFSRKTLAAAYPSGAAGVDQKALEAEINKQLWGTGGRAGVYSQMARRGLSELQPETQYATSRVVSESMQDLLNQYQNRQIAAMNAARTAELTEPTFRLSEASLTGEYGGAPTLAREQMDIDRMLREAGLTGTYRGEPTEARLARQATEALQAGQLTGTYGGAPTLAREQFDINKLLAEAGLTGTYGGAPTLAARQLEQQAGLTREEFGLRRDLLAQQIQATNAQQGRTIDFETARYLAGNLLQRELQGGQLGFQREELAQRATLTREQLAQQARISDLEMQLRRELQTQAEAARRGDQTAELASRERIAQLQAELTRSQQALEQSKALGSIGGIPTLENVLGERKLDIFQSAIKAAEQQARNKMYSDLLAGLAMRSGIIGTGVGAAGPGVIDRLLQGTIGRAGNAVVDAILRGIGGGGTAAWPTFTDLGLETPALGPLSEMDEWVWVPDDAFSGISDVFSGIFDSTSGISDISDLLLGGFF